jgi:hypothetical protein
MALSPLYDIFDPNGDLRRRAQFIDPSEFDGEPDDQFQPIGVAPLGPRKPRITDLMPEEEKSGLLSRLAQTGASGLSGLGWILDTPGAVVRGTISGLAEGDPLKGLRALGQTSDERTDGRELLRQFGMAGDKDTWGSWLGGFGAEALLDPLTYVGGLGLIGKGFGAGGRLASRAGLLDDAALMAKNAGKGTREFLRSNTPRSIIGTGDEAASAMERFTNAAKGAGLNPEDYLDQPLSGLAELRIPGMERGVLFHGGELGDRAARAVDQFGETLKTNPITGPVVNRVTAAFDPNVMGEIDPDQQWTMRRASSLAKQGERAELERLSKLQFDALRSARPDAKEGLQNFYDRKIQNVIRDLVEAGGDVTKIADQEAASAVLNNPAWKSVYEAFANRGPEFYGRAKDLGLELGKWTGESGDMFFPSQSVWFDSPQLPDLPERVARTERTYSRGSRALNLDENFSRGRRTYTDLPNRAQTFRQLMGGTFGKELQDKLLAAGDNDVPGIIDEAFKSLKMDAPFEKGIKEVQDLLADQTLIPADRTEYTAKLDQLVAKANQNKVQLGDLLRKADRQFAANDMGLFDRSSFDDMVRYSTGRARVEANAQVVTDELLKGAKDVIPGDMPGGGWIPLEKAAADLGFDPVALRKAIQTQRGTDITNLSVSEKLVSALKRLSPQVPKEQGAIGNLYDSYTNAFKVGALANPAYHTRNLYSGFLSTLTSGATNPVSLAQDAYAGWKAGRGDYEPLLKRLRGAPGMTKKLPDGTVADLTDEEILRQVLSGAARNQLGGGQLTDLEGLGEQATKALFPGAVKPEAAPLIGDNGILWDSDRTWGDWLTTRGVGFKAAMNDNLAAPSTTKNPLLKIHESVGQQVEDANRLGAYIGAIRRGYSPDAAAELVYKTQVDYRPSAFTDTERALKKGIPFYSYTRGIAPLVAENIVERPGGLQSQLIRATNLGGRPTEDSFVPDHLRSSAAIPLPDELGGSPGPGVKRFLNNIDYPFEGLINLVSPGLGATPFQVAGSTLQKTGQNLLGQLNPLIKTPLEMLTNRQFYSGQQLSDLYSVLGNSGLGPWGQPVEQVLTAVPGGTKAMSIYRTLADERIPLADRLFKLGINLTAGAKLTDVDVERTRKQAARNVLTDILDMQPGVKTYENITVPEDVLRAMPRDQQQMYLLYKILQSQASKRAREKRKLEMDPLQMLGVVQQDLA